MIDRFCAYFVTYLLICSVSVDLDVAVTLETIDVLNRRTGD